MTPAEIRLEGIQAVLEGSDDVVFVDSDDIMDPARVEHDRRALERADAVACALDLIDVSGRGMGVTMGLAPGETIDSIVPRWNVFGLSNSAYRGSRLGPLLSFPPECVLLDWLLVTRAWLSELVLHFSGTPLMKYRRYGANTTCLLPPFTVKDVRSATDQVSHHYSALTRDKSPWAPARWERVVQERKRVDAFKRGVCVNAEKLEAYTKALNTLPYRCVWAWAVANPYLENLWKV
jgi:hypothetical protein